MDRNSHKERKEVNSMVALRKESVDRNTLSIIILGLRQVVALRKESVDRNFGQGIQRGLDVGRSPQGERG